MNYVKPFCTEIVDLIFQRVYEKNGRISSFVRKDKFCSFGIEDCLVEEIAFDKCCSISCTRSFSSFNLDFELSDKKVEKNTLAFSSGEVFATLTKAFLESGTCICSSVCKSESIEFSFFLPLENFSKLIKECLKNLNESFWHEKEISIEVKHSMLFISLIFATGILSEESVLQMLLSYSKLFDFVENPKETSFYRKKILFTKQKKKKKKVFSVLSE